VVTTHKGAEGLEVTHGLNILAGDSPDEFAGNIIKLLNDHDMRQKLANNAYQLVCEKYEWSVVMPRFINLVEATISRYNSEG
jgi:glycosyltransferase involved in cell wall biosynthesis